MCGIAGVVNGAGVTPAHVKRMVDQIQYRGRDEQGVEAIGRAVVGHARLAVVDPENGKQPMSNTDGSVWVTFNGEIYNYVELREELKAKGYHFKSRCDTEVLVHLWREEGEKMLDRLIGMFAFFIWDTKLDRGMLARDRQGIKPCFIADYQGGLAFASEMKSILSLPNMPCEINPAGLKQVFAFNYCPPPQTCFKGITHLEPGHYLLFEGAAKPVKKRYWQWPFAEEKRTPSYEEFEALMDDAVRLQMRFDVDGGMYLSGGVDSSIVAYHLKKQWKFPRLEAFGLNFPLQAYSEYQYSEQVAKLMDIDLAEARIMPEMIPGIASKVVQHAEQPHGDFSFFLFYLLASRANTQKKIVMFTGDGPDEALAGFRHNEQYFHTQNRMNFSLSSYFDVICYMDDVMRARLLNPDFERATPNPVDRFEEILEPYRDLEPMEQIVAYECTSLMPGNNLVKGDRMGACWSTEGRAPMLDHRISELFVRLPVNQKFKEGVGKYYLKEYAAKKFPRELIFKEKSMPTLPIGEWMKTTLYDWARESFSRLDNAYINRNAALALLEEHKSGAKNHTRALRTLLMTQLWMEHMVQAQSARQAA
ncbi:MAG: asparagine synthase (glutamine-hydrolyzing) [Proteobacteria bacterium]|nr:asparagine synthase (glutamine-hydrolyzing) [Pseudomonadota bacterium]